jgi:Tfp pilus assembly protein PilX
MKCDKSPNGQNSRRDERGAALITVLMISTLLLAVGGALILLTSTTTRTTIDSNAEMQAYYAAEAGLQNSLNVLRGNVAAQAGMPAGTKISFRNAIKLSTANSSGDSGPTCLESDPTSVCRLSGWLNYDYTSTGSASPDRVSLTSSYAPTTGLAYSVAVSDPDNSPIASGEPARLLLRVIGYGPKGAVKRLELVIKRSNFDYSPPAMIMMRGSDDGTPVNFNIGNSNAKDYTGHDHAGTDVLPSFGSTNDGDRNIEIAEDGKETVADPKASTIINSALPSFLQSADLARAFLAEQKGNAVSQGRYFSSFSGTSGSVATPAFTFVDGNCSLDGGAGLLIVTGTLTMSGNPSFSGLVLVLGDGIVQRDGGGNGNIYGAMAVARFPKTGNGGFQAATFNTNGGGNALMQYDSAAVRAALNVTGPKVQGVHEY